jgi:hypothetical protein
MANYNEQFTENLLTNYIVIKLKFLYLGKTNNL